MKTPSKLKGDFIQALGILTVTAGICAEIALGADIWYIVLTGGAFIFALGTKVKHGGI